MSISRIKPFLLLFFLGVLVLLVVQNLEPIAIVLFNQQIAWKLPLGAWVALSIVAGVITSLTIQLLYPRRQLIEKTSREAKNRQFNSSPQDINSSNATSADRNPPPNFDLQERVRKSKNVVQREITSPDDVETLKQDELPDSKIRDRHGEDIRDRQSDAPTRDSKDRSDSNYSYRYSKKTRSKDFPTTKKSNTNEVYDAQYRVIRPPDSPIEDEEPSSFEEGEQEDWI